MPFGSQVHPIGLVQLRTNHIIKVLNFVIFSDEGG